MEYRALGRSTLTVSRVGFGGAPIGGFDYGSIDEREAVAAIHEALDAGINFFDVADVYGFGAAETLLGRALEGKRDRAVIATKFGLAWESGSVVRDNSARRVAEALDASLRRLRTDRIDLYQIHWPDPATPLAETAGALSAALQTGKIRAIGCSNFSLDQLRELHALVPVSSIQVAYNLLCRAAERELVGWCRGAGVWIIAHSVLARGVLAGRRAPGAQFEGTDTRSRSRYFDPDPAKEALLQALRGTAKRHDASQAAVAVAWALAQPGIDCVLAGIKNREQLADAAAAASLQLDAAEIARLSELSASCAGVMEGELAR